MATSFAATDRQGDSDWQRLAVKFEQLFGYPPNPAADAGKLLRDIRGTDPEWASAAYTFISTFGYAPSAQTAAKLQRDIRNARVTPGGIGEAPVKTGAGTVIPDGARLVILRNPTGSDAKQLYYLVYEWQGVEIAYEIGDAERYIELFGPKVETTFDSVTGMTQAQFDKADFVLGGSADQKYGQKESEASLIERQIKAAGLEDLPSWIAGSQEAKLLIAKAAADEWSSGRLWQELSTTSAFKGRFGDAWQKYHQEGTTIGEAVDLLVRDENALREAIRPFLAGETAASTEFLQGMLNKGWTPGFVAQVLEQAEVLRRDPESLGIANAILESSGLSALDEVGFLNALAGYGPQDTVEAINTATAARALDEAGIDLADTDLDLIMELVDTSDRLLTADSWRNLSQELALNLVRHGRELDEAKLGVDREDLISAAFGRESPTGKSSGEVLSLLARFERDRRAAAEGFEGGTSFMDESGRLRTQGLASL